jgi:superfamily II DNA or RNA helicase
MVISCTGSGKSAVISIISGFLINKQKKGLILVPSINLVSQIHNDMLDYGLNELYDNTHLIGGEYTEKHFDKPLTVSTWQSVRLFKEHLDEIDFILVDEAQGLKGSESLDISQKCVNAEYKFGLSGTMPEEPIDRMSIMSAVGTPTIYIRTQGLIELGLATPVNINAIKLKYDSNVIHEYSKLSTHHQRLKYIKEYENRNLFISSLARQVTENSGNTLVLFEHVEHGKNIFKNICKSRIGIDPENKLITGKKAFEFQKEHRLYFINGDVKGGVREQIRNILETDTDAILVANYSTMSTGVNIKNLHNIVFASPMKSFVTITQSIGRGIRTHVSKDVVNIYDLVDDFKNFIKQYNYRKEWSYETEGFPLIESHIWI